MGADIRTLLISAGWKLEGPKPNEPMAANYEFFSENEALNCSALCFAGS
jgi:hypothetical protein